MLKYFQFLDVRQTSYINFRVVALSNLPKSYCAGSNTVHKNIYLQTSGKSLYLIYVLLQTLHLCEKEIFLLALTEHKMCSSNSFFSIKATKMQNICPSVCNKGGIDFLYPQFKIDSCFLFVNNLYTNGHPNYD